jgi:carbon-monoxide dehydrogenase small subunit
VSVEIQLWVNDRSVRATVDDRLLLADFLRDDLRLTGTHLGCEHGVCGACTVLVDGLAARSCLMVTAQADGCRVTTIEGLATPGGPLHPVQQAFRDCHGLQCGFCTPGMVLATIDLLHDNPNPTETEIREALSGNVCRCTGYDGIVRAVQQAAVALRTAGDGT